MTIERVINGVIYEFPDGTSEATIRKFEAQKSGQAAPQPAPTTAARPSSSAPAPFSTGAGSQLLQGLTLGFSDEAIAAMRSAMGQGAYEDLVKGEREALRQYSEANPVTSTAAQIAGGVVPAVVTGGASLIPGVTRAAASTMGPKAAALLFGTKPTVGRLAATGAGSGAVSAVGTTEKPAGEWAEEAAKGAAAGAAGAGSAALVGKYVVMPGYRRLKSALGYGDTNRMADVAIAKALEKDGLTPEAAAQKLAAFSRGEMTLADLGENTAGLLRRASATPGAARMETKAALATREVERIPRVSEDLRSLMSGSKDFYTDVTDLIKKRGEDAQALYKAAYDASPSFTPQTAPEIAKLRALPSFQSAMKDGARRMQDLGLDIGDPKNTLRALHETKLALDDMIESAVRKGEGNQARTLIDMKNRMLRDMEQASPEYKIAREAYAGDSELLAAMKEGQRIYQLPEQEMRKLITRFQDSPSEYDAFRSGIAQAMLEKMRTAGPGTDPMKAILSRDAEQKLRRAFRDDAAFDEFKNRLAQEQTMLTTEKTGFRRTVADTDLDTQGASGVGAATSLVQGRPVQAALEAVRTAVPGMTGMPPRLAQPVTQRLLTPSTRVDPVIDSIMSSLKQQEADLLQQAGITGTGAAMTGALTAARPPQEQFPQPLPGPAGMPMPPGASPLQLGLQ